MSHVISIQTRYRSLDLLEKACRALGWELRRGQLTFNWYGSGVGDYHAENAAYRQGVDPSQYGKCSHAIKVPGASYEIGVVQDGQEWRLLYDSWYSGGLLFLETADPLPQEYARQGVLEAYHAQDLWEVGEGVKDKDGNLILEFERRA